MIGNRTNRLPERRDAKRTFDGRRVRRTRRSTERTWCFLTKRIGEGELVEIGGVLSRTRERKQDGSSQSELTSPKRGKAALSSDVAYCVGFWTPAITRH